MDVKSCRVNGIDAEAVRGLAASVEADPAAGRALFEAETAWKGGARSDTRIEGWSLGDRRLPRDFTLRCDEPSELLGCDTAPNPQELLLTAFNACLVVAHVAAFAVAGIELRSLSVRTEGAIDLRGFFGIDDATPPGFASLRSTVKIAATASAGRIREIHESVLRASPNRWSIGCAVGLKTELVVVES
jgi:uncharacterized OsmC-like protein